MEKPDVLMNGRREMNSSPRFILARKDPEDKTNQQ